ncbi:KilA-N domain-containing protein [Moraxella bovis]|uniref:KilA-N domain-containing protein n=1 Tax=Moraxella bovis TaxID=476 RepID=UPI0013C36A7E|nr:KilA-N domain-containing protein [Moraxella bovis]
MNNLPQIAPQGNLIIADTTIHMVDGLYSLNDLHRASGGLKKYKPSNFMRNNEVQELIAEIEQVSDLSLDEKSVAYKTVHGGKNNGTYVCKELVYRYAMWVSPKFSLMVIRTFDNLVQGQMMENYTLLDQFNKAVLELEKVSDIASQAGRMLNLAGKQFKPKAKERVLELTIKIQPYLPFVEFGGAK